MFGMVVIDNKCFGSEYNFVLVDGRMDGCYNVGTKGRLTRFKKVWRAHDIWILVVMEAIKHLI